MREGRQRARDRAVKRAGRRQRCQAPRTTAAARTTLATTPTNGRTRSSPGRRRPVSRCGRSASSAVIPNSSRLPLGEMRHRARSAHRRRRRPGRRGACGPERREARAGAGRSTAGPGSGGRARSPSPRSRGRTNPAQAGQSASGIARYATRIANRSWDLSGVSVKYCLSARNITMPKSGNEIAGREP